jgi:energy-coupling factor transport system ATP-binding protein
MRRVALAGVLAMTPRILVLDEPTAGLDPRARAYLLKDIQHLHEEGTTVVMISHSMDDVAQLATRIAVLEQGRLVTTGTPEEIFEQFDRLTQMGLDVPQASKLSHLLRDKGVAIPLNYQLEPLADALEQLLKGGACHAQ